MIRIWWFIKDWWLGKPLGGLRSPGWHIFSKQIIKEMGECEATGSKKNLEAHNIIPFHKRPDLELDRKNVIILNKWIHFFLAHFGYYGSWNENIREDAKWLKAKIKNRP